MKRHEFEMIAAALREARTAVDISADPVARVWREAQHITDCEAIADALARGTAPGGNRAFDRELFLRNAGVNEP